MVSLFAETLRWLVFAPTRATLRWLTMILQELQVPNVRERQDSRVDGTVTYVL